MQPFGLNSTMGSSWRVNGDDVVNTKTVLRDLGYYTPPSHGIGHAALPRPRTWSTGGEGRHRVHLPTHPR